MAQVPSLRRIAEQLRPGQHPPLEEVRLEMCDLFVGHEDVDAEIEHARFVLALFCLGAANEGPAADVTRDEPAPRRLGIGACDGCNGDAQVIGQVAMRRQTRTGPERSLLYVL